MYTGVHAHAELIEQYGRRGFERAVSAGELTAITRGWYAASQARSDVVAAVRAGGRLGCLSAAAVHGLWVPTQPYLHVAVRRRDQRLPATSGRLQFHGVRRWSDRQPVTTLWETLDQVVRHHDAETGMIVLESALNQRLITMADAATLTAGLPERKRSVFQHLVSSAQSGSETRVRLFLARRGVPVESQFFLPGVGRVDIRAGRSQLYECDSRRFHTATPYYEADRERDLIISGDRYRMTRLSYVQIWDGWDQTSARLLDTIRRRWHRVAP